jgi:hypothetical protein
MQEVLVYKGLVETICPMRSNRVRHHPPSLGGILGGTGQTCVANRWAPPPHTRLVSGQVGAIIRWRKADNEEPYQATIKRDDWETVLPECVFRRSDMR